jgi:SAM-dependent methyltransferase
MLEFMYGSITPQAIRAAAKLGIADIVASAPATAAELAATAGADPTALSRLLKFLASIGIFSQDTQGKFRQTPLSDTLRVDHPQSVRGAAIGFGSAYFWDAFAHLPEAVVTGRPAFDDAFGASFFDYLAAHPEDAASFDAAMTSMSSTDLPAILAAYDFSSFECVVDVGGGHGALLHGILSANPKLRGVLVDLPSVVAKAEKLRSEAVSPRCEVVGGDIFEAVPRGADGYLARLVIHDWNDDDALKILKNCRAAISPGGKLLLIESVLKETNEPDPARLGDVWMLALTPGGKERTESEFASLLGRAGFALTRVIPAEGYAIIESQPV